MSYQVSGEAKLMDRFDQTNAWEKFLIENLSY